MAGALACGSGGWLSDDLMERIDQLLAVDFGRLLDAIEEADEALLDFEAGKRVHKPTATPAPVSRRGQRKTPEPRAPRIASPRRLRAAWDEIRGQVLTHIETERTLVLPGCKHVVEGLDQIRGGLMAPVRQMVADHRTIDHGVLTVRLEAARVEPVRREFLLVCRLWDEHVQAEESFIFPESLAEMTADVPVISATFNRQQNADEVGARLRLAAARKSAEAPEPEAAGLVGRFFSFLGKRQGTF